MSSSSSVTEVDLSAIRSFGGRTAAGEPACGPGAASEGADHAAVVEVLDHVATRPRYSHRGPLEKKSAARQVRVDTAERQFPFAHSRVCWLRPRWPPRRLHRSGPPDPKASLVRHGHYSLRHMPDVLRGVGCCCWRRRRGPDTSAPSTMPSARRRQRRKVG